MMMSEKRGLPVDVELALYGDRDRCAVCNTDATVVEYPLGPGGPELGFCEVHEPDENWNPRKGDGFAVLRDGSKTVQHIPTGRTWQRDEPCPICGYDWNSTCYTCQTRRARRSGGQA